MNTEPEFKWENKAPREPVITIAEYTLDTMHSVYSRPNWFQRLLGAIKEFQGWNFTIEIKVSEPAHYFRPGDVIGIGIDYNDRVTDWYVQGYTENRPNSFRISNLKPIVTNRPIIPGYRVFKLYSTYIDP